MKYLLWKVSADKVEKIYEVEDKRTEPFRLLRGLITLKEVKEKLFGEKGQNYTIINSGINRISTNNEGLTSGENKNPDDVVYTDCSTILGVQFKGLDDKTEFVEYEDENGNKKVADFKLLLTGYNHGFVISNGKEQSNFFGGVHMGYIYSFTRRQNSGTSMRSTCGKKDAKLFSLKQLDSFIEKHSYSLKYFVSEKGYKFEVDFADNTFKKWFMANAKQKDLDLLQKIEEKLVAINSAESTTEVEELSGIATDEEMKQEALDRMTAMKMDIAPYEAFEKRNQIWKSEGPGILYYLPQNDEDSEKAIEEVTTNDYLPYHVIKSQLMDMPVCAVLGVSRDKANWSLERYNERNQTLYTQVYNPQFGIEYGPIVVLPSAGGLRRIG